VGKSLWHRRIRRCAFAASYVGILMAASVVAFISVIFRFVPMAAISVPSPSSSWMDAAFWLLLAFIVALLIIAGVQTLEKYRRLTYDPTLALKYQEMFDAMWENGDRRRAALVLRDHKADLAHVKEKRKELSPIDEVLDLFEDIGFLVEGDQISPEVAHHFFHHWIRGYYLNAKPYIEAWEVKEPSRWEYWASLYHITNEVEREREKKSGKPGGEQEDLDKFLTEEIGDDGGGERS
jgi:hypothetical protein